MLAAEIYQVFLHEVVKAGAFSDEERRRGIGGRPLSDDAQNKVRDGKRVDERAPLLVRVSGKGGWSRDGAYNRFTNVTLLDHLASVVRGALTIGEIDLRASGVAEDGLKGRLAMIAAVAWLHDADKILEDDRKKEVAEDDVEELIKRYRLDAFAGKYGLKIDPARMAIMIDEAEVTRTGRMRPGKPLLTSEEAKDCKYVMLADRLDSIFLDTEKSLDDLVREIARFDGLRTDALRKGWRALRITSPHTPFLLEDLLGGLSAACFDEHSHPPLIELHHDGELLCVAPEAGFDAVFEGAIDRLARRFGGGPRVIVNNKGARDILDGRCFAEEIGRILRKDRALAEKCLFVSVDLISFAADSGVNFKAEIEDLFTQGDLAPIWPDLSQYSGRLFSPWPARSDSDGAADGAVIDAATIAVALACKEPDDKALAKAVPDAAAREGELHARLAEHSAEPPEWIKTIKHEISRHSLLSAYAAQMAVGDVELRSALLGKGGLIDIWLNGNSDRKGLLEKNGDVGGAYATAARDWFGAMAERRFIAVDNTDADGRCHFTNAPVSRGQKIDSATGLYGVNVTAFSGREGRPEELYRTTQETLVSPIAQAEHRLRSLRAEKTSARDHTPILISSPTSAGLFASLIFDRNLEPGDLRLHDVLRLDRAKGVTFSDIDALTARRPIAQYEALSPRTDDLISFIKMVMEAAMRTSRPIHVFRGLPRPEPAFVSFDFLPESLEQALGGRAFRLEQLPGKITFLQMIETIAAAGGLGLALALRVADPISRFGACCEAIVRIDRQDNSQLTSLRNQLTRFTEESTPMPQDDAIVRFAAAMARVQRGPLRSDGVNFRDLGLRTALGAVDGAARIGQTSRESLISAVSGAVLAALERGDNSIARAERRDGESLKEAMRKAAELFVDDVWPHAFGGSSPASRLRRVAFAIYGVSFERTAHANAKRGADCVDTNSET